MKCSYCGHELSDNAEFCEKCGMILGFADDKKDGSAEADAEFTQNVFQALDFDDAELDVVAMELPVSDYEETVEVSHNIPEYVSSPEDEAADYTAEPEKAFEEAEEALQNEIENLPAEDEIPTIEAEFEAPEYTPVPDVVISAKKASDAIKESNHKKEGRKKMADFKVIESQEQFDEAIKKRIEQADRTTKEAFKDYLSPEEVKKLKDDFDVQIKDMQKKNKEDLDALKNQMATDSEKLNKVNELEGKCQEYELKITRYNVAHEKGIPFEFAERLVGTTKEELEKDAESISSFVKTKGAPPLRIPTGDESTSTELSLKTLLSDLKATD